MTRRTLRINGFIYNDVHAVVQYNCFVAFGTGGFLVGTGQCESALCVVVEEYRFEPVFGMTCVTRRLRLRG